MDWNFKLHVNNTNTLPKIWDNAKNSRRIGCSLPTFKTTTPDAHCCETTAKSRALELIRRINTSAKRNLPQIMKVSINQTVRFYVRMHGWRQGTVSRMDSPTI